MYAKIFSSLWDGTLATDWPGWSLLVFMIANCDPDGTVDMTQQAMAARTGIPLEQVHAAIERLSAPDQESRSKEDDGRRIVLIAPGERTWGWSIVNYKHYRELMDAETVRLQNRERKRIQRDKEQAERDVSHGVTECHAPSRNVTPGHAPSRQEEVEVEEEPASLPPLPPRTRTREAGTAPAGNVAECAAAALPKGVSEAVSCSQENGNTDPATPTPYSLPADADLASRRMAEAQRQKDELAKAVQEGRFK